MHESRLPFTIPEYEARVIWSSGPAFDTWQQRLLKIADVWHHVERLSVVQRIRPAALQIVPSSELPTVFGFCSKYGLHASVLERQGDSWRIVIAVSSDLAHQMHVAWVKRDDVTIGQIIGFPDCCVTWFNRLWNEEKWRDTTWHMTNKSHDESNPRVRTIEGPIQNNLMLRWLGVRFVPHLPCSFDCEASVALGRAMSTLWDGGELAEVHEWAVEALSWPAEWSGLHGIAEVKTPLFKFSASTDATAHKFVVRRMAQPDRPYPELGASGNEFPYVRKVPIVRELLVRKPKTPESDWKENDFTSPGAMTVAHNTVIRAFESSTFKGGKILDLGCGNGALLEKLGKRWPESSLYGIEVQPDRTVAARKRLPNAEILTQNIRDVPDESKPNVIFDAVLFMPGRLLEMGSSDHERVLRWLCVHSRAIIVYAYGDWINRHGGLIGLCERVGLTQTVVCLKKGEQVEAGVIYP